MANVTIKKTENAGDYSKEISFEAKDIDYLNEDLIKSLFKDKTEEQTEKVIKIADAPGNREVEHDVVAIYDNAGIPSIMHRFRKTINEELFGGSKKTHPAFIIGGKEYDEIFISVYENCEINGKPYSLPYQKPWTNITNDDAAKACFSKGEGWHLMTAQEWGLVANTCLKNGTLPHGNTNNGRYHADGSEYGKTYDNYKTLTGSGPATWTHNYKPEGVHDLCGNIWEMIRGLRMKDGKLQTAENNDAALDTIDLTLEGDDWKNVIDDNSKSIMVSAGDGITFTTDPNIEQNYSGDCWEDVKMECESEQLKELALFAGEPKAYCYIDSTDGEYFPVRGGVWSSGAGAGVFCLILNDPRSYSGSGLGFRSAYFKKN